MEKIILYPFTMIYNTSESHKKIATVMAQMWKQKLGINALRWKMWNGKHS